MSKSVRHDTVSPDLQRAESGATTTRPSAAHEIIDVDASMQRLAGDRELFAELAQMFSEDAPQLLEKLDRSIAAGDAATTRRAAHSLKGLAANFGARPCVSAALELELAGKTDQLDDAPQLLAALKSAVSALEAALLPYFSPASDVDRRSR